MGTWGGTYMVTYISPGRQKENMYTYIMLFDTGGGGKERNMFTSRAGGIYGKFC